MIKALLDREANVTSARIAAPINQGDQGRDLLISWRVNIAEYATSVSAPNPLIKVVGQCKASNSPVGKSKVQDIRDTVEFHQASGYFLAVSTQITAPLTQALENLKSKGIWTDWWNREDIEYRLSKNQELIPLFPKVLKSSSSIKFVEAEKD